MFERLTKHAGKLEDRNMNVELGGGTLGLEDFVDDFYELDGFADTSYFETLERHGIDTSEGIDSCDIDHGDIDLIRSWRPLLRRTPCRASQERVSGPLPLPAEGARRGLNGGHEDVWRCDSTAMRQCHAVALRHATKSKAEPSLNLEMH